MMRDAPLDLPRLRLLCPDPQQRARLLAMALEHLRADHARLRQAMGAHDHAAAAERVHHIKGGASMLCAAGHPLLDLLDGSRAALLYGHAAPVDAAMQALEAGLRQFEARLREALGEVSA